jgi:hypothetical protein
MALRDSNWKIDKYLQEAKPDAFIGSVKFLLEMSEQRASELRLSRQASFMSTSDCRDVRIYFNDMCFFTVEKLLMNLEKFSKRGTVDEVIARNLKLNKKASDLA